jgi:hypothetical protein
VTSTSWEPPGGARPIFVDFLKTNDSGAIRLVTIGSREDLEAGGIILTEGRRVYVYTDDADEQGDRDDLVSSGLVRRDEDRGEWVVELDWPIRHQSEMQASDQ